MNTTKKNCAFWKCPAILLAVVFMAVPFLVKAQGWSPMGWALDSFYDIILAMVSAVVNFVGMFLITIAGSIVNFAFNFESFVTVPIVQVGWTISRDLANMGFILIMLAIAFGTVLRIETYSVKKLIPKLVVAALVINFSLIICGTVIDFGNSLARFFVSGGTPGAPAEVGTAIMSSMRAGAIAQLRNNVSAQAPVTTLIMASVGQLLMYVIIFFILLALAGVMISRIVQLWLLIIFSPFAWISYASPKHGGYFSKWWSKFFDLAVVFPVSISFFVFLGVLTGASFSGTAFANVKDVGGWGAIFPVTLFSAVMQFIVVVAILWLGIEQARKAGTIGGNMVVKWADSAKTAFMGQLKASPKFLGGAAYRAADKISGGKIDTGFSRMKTEGIRTLEKVPLIGRAIGNIGAHAQRQKEALKAAAGKTSKFTPNDIKARMRQAAFTPEGLAERAGMVQNLIEKGKFDLDTDKDFKNDWLKYIQTYQNNGGNIIDLIKKRPDLAEKPEIQKMIATDVNSPPPVATKWKNVFNESDPNKKIEDLKAIIKSDIIKNASDFAGVQQEAFDTKGKLTPALEKQYKDIEDDKEKLKKKREIEAKTGEQEIESTGDIVSDTEKEKSKLESQLAEAKLKKDVATVATLTPQLKKVTDTLSQLTVTLAHMEATEEDSMRKYIAELKKLEEQQNALTGKGAQMRFLEIVTEEFKKKGNLDAGYLNSLNNKNKDAYINLLKYLKMHAPGIKYDLKDPVYKHIIGSLVAGTMADQTPPPAPAAP